MLTLKDFSQNTIKNKKAITGMYTVVGSHVTADRKSFEDWKYDDGQVICGVFVGDD